MGVPESLLPSTVLSATNADYGLHWPPGLKLVDKAPPSVKRTSSTSLGSATDEPKKKEGTWAPQILPKSSSKPKRVCPCQATTAIPLLNWSATSPAPHPPIRTSESKVSQVRLRLVNGRRTWRNFSRAGKWTGTGCLPQITNENRGM